MRLTPHETAIVLTGVVLARMLADGPGSGNWGHAGRPGEVGGSAPGKGSKGKGPGGGTLHKYSPETIATAYAMHKAGASTAAIKAATGISATTQKGHFTNLKAKEAALTAALSTPAPAPAPVATLPEAPAPAPPPTPSSPTQQATAYGYQWQEKTYGPNKGKYAWFQEGVQVSAPHPQGDSDAAAASMHYGKGPQKPAVATPTPDGWPIDNTVVRKLGTKYPAKVESHYASWASHLDAGETTIVQHYTGSAYMDINPPLWQQKALHEVSYGSHTAETLQQALHKAPTPPPPELVWRGMSSGFPHVNAGDTIQLPGFQSTSIKPTFAQSWGGGTTILEIKPRSGAYVRTISHHKGEYEFLLPHGRQYKVRGLTKVRMEGHSTPMTVIQLEDMGPHGTTI